MPYRALGHYERRHRRLERKKQAHPPKPNQILRLPLSVLVGCNPGSKVDPVPGWFMGRELYCWCETHCCWNLHGYTPDSDSTVDYRCSHHHDDRVPLNHEGNLAIIVQGPAPQDFYGKVLNRLLEKRHTLPLDSMVRVIELL
jgi:hypothetical protein